MHEEPVSTHVGARRPLPCGRHGACPLPGPRVGGWSGAAPQEDRVSIRGLLPFSSRCQQLGGDEGA